MAGRFIGRGVDFRASGLCRSQAALGNDREKRRNFPVSKMPPRTLSDWLLYAQSLHPRGIDMGLARVERAREAMKLNLAMPVVLVGGTNGKGSVCAIIESALAESGLKTGCFASPHLLHFNERIRINAQPASDDAIADAFAQVESARKQIGETITYFEFSALAAARVFAEQQCECAILEVGMGGRLDAVNIFQPAVSVVTNVGTDHAEFLGPTRDDIAREKAGILRNNTPAILGDADFPESFLHHAENIGANVRQLGKDFSALPVSAVAWRFRGGRDLADLPLPAMRGAHQLKNAATAVAAMDALPGEMWPGGGGIRRGLQRAVLPGRGQVLPGRPVVVLDVAHNRESAECLERMLFEMGFFSKTTAVVGMFARKDADAFVLTLAKRVDKWIAVRPEGGDLPAEKMAEAIRRNGGEVECAESVSAAVSKARAESGENDRIVITGSFVVVADFLAG